MLVYETLIIHLSARLDSENLIADLHKCEQINLFRNIPLLRLGELMLAVCESLECLLALLAGDVTSTLQVV